MLLCVTKESSRVKVQHSLTFHYQLVTWAILDYGKTKFWKAFGSHLAYFMIKQFVHFINAIIPLANLVGHHRCYTVSTFKDNFQPLINSWYRIANFHTYSILNSNICNQSRKKHPLSVNYSDTFFWISSILNISCFCKLHKKIMVEFLLH